MRSRNIIYYKYQSFQRHISILRSSLVQLIQGGATEEDANNDAADADPAEKGVEKPNATPAKNLQRTDSDEDNKKFHDGKRKNPKVRDEDRMFVNLGLIDLVNVKNDALLKIIKPR